MNLAFNTALTPGWSLVDVPARAASLGFDAVEVHLPRPTGDDPAAGSILADRDLVKLVFEQAKVRLAGLSASLQFRGRGHDDAAPAVRRVLDLAKRLDCPLVRVLDTAVQPGHNHATAALELAERLIPLADHAGDAGVTLLIHNALTFRTAPDMWRLIEQVNHPALAVAWDPLASAVAGEDPMVAVPVLNSRIQQVLLRDATLSNAFGASDGLTAARQVERQVVALRRIGDGELDLRRTIDRLRGIGFAGPLVVSYPPVLAEGVGPPEDLLSHAIETLTKWTAVQSIKKPVGKAVA